MKVVQCMLYLLNGLDSWREWGQGRVEVPADSLHRLKKLKSLSSERSGPGLQKYTRPVTGKVINLPFAMMISLNYL